MYIQSKPDCLGEKWGPLIASWNCKVTIKILDTMNISNLFNIFDSEGSIMIHAPWE